MAEFFNRVNGMMKGNQRKSDILKQEGGSQGATQPQEGGEKQPGSKSPGTIGEGGGGAAAGEGKGRQLETDTAADFLERGKEQVTDVDISSPIDQSIQSTQESLTEEADKYKTDVGSYAEESEAGQVMAEDSDTLDKAIGGDLDAMDLVRQGLTGQADIGEFDFEYNLQDDLGKIQQLGTTGGVQQALMAEQSDQADYTRRMAELDAALFRRSDAMKDKIKAAQERAAALAGSVSAEQEAAKEAREGELEQYASFQDALKGELGKRSSTIREAIKARQAEEQAKIDAAIEKQKATALIQAQEAYEDYVQQYKDAYKDLPTDYVGMPGIAGNPDTSASRSWYDAGLKDLQKMAKGGWEDYIDIVRPELTLSEVTKEDEAERFNRIMGLLGQGDLLTSTTARTGSASANLNNLLGAVAARTADERKGIKSALAERERYLAEQQRLKDEAAAKAKAAAEKAAREAKAKQPVLPGQLAIDTSGVGYDIDPATLQNLPPITVSDDFDWNTIGPPGTLAINLGN